MISKLANNKILNSKPTQSVAGAALIISIAGIVSRLLGLVRDRILASQFGAGDVLDVYYAAFRVPDLIYNLLVVGALSAAFIPVFSGLMSRKDEKNAWKLSSGILTLMVLVVIVIAILLSIFAPYIMQLITPGFSPEKMDQVVLFTRVMFLSPLFLGISAIYGGILVSFKKFLVYSLAPIMYNIGIIFGAIFFVEFWGPIGLAWGVVLGAVLHMMIQYPATKLSGFNYSLNLRKIFKDRNVKRVIKLMIPRSLGMAVNQINLIVITIFASTLASGSLAVFNFANNIQSVPMGLFGISFAVAAFPHLSALTGKKNRDKFARVFSKTFRRILYFVFPLSVLLFVLRAEITRAILGSGKFDWEDTVLTLNVLGLLSLSLFAQSLIPLLARAFYAIENTKIPFYIALISEAINIALVLLLIGNFQILGLAIAFSVATTINMLLLLFLLRRKMGDLEDRKLISSSMKIVFASILAGIATQLARYFLSSYFLIELETLAEVLFQLIFAGGIGILTFIYLSYYLNVEEFSEFKKTLWFKIFGVPTESPEPLKNGVKTK